MCAVAVPVSNDRIAGMLAQVADLLERQEANDFRIRSYRQAAESVRGAPRPVAEILDERGLAGLKDLPGVGQKLAAAIAEIARTGQFGLLERLRAEVTPEAVLAEVPGVGPTLARRIHEQLGIDTLEELERAAHDGRLEQVEGIGAEKAAGVRDALAGRLSRSARRRAGQRPGERPGPADRPDVDVLLDVDAEYRRKAEAGVLRTIAPRRFNPEGEAWLPILHARRGDWEFTALFSNTARAHELGTTHDWVVLYYTHGGAEGQATVITAGSGALAGRRVVRGREGECRRYYEQD
ncbi:MAG: DNA-binding protein [Planctomycetes bacterium]|nr:DNA-binding protein [Planctomycetota bacterium]